MRLLFLTNFYPPARPGGYTQWCHEVAQRLGERGHSVGVLTSRHERHKAPPHERDIWRRLHLEGDLEYYQPLHFLTRWKGRHQRNLRTLEESIGRFQPDLLFVWGMWALSKALPAHAERLLPGRVVYYLSDYWLRARSPHDRFWQTPAQRWYMRFPKRLVGRWALAMLGGARERPLALEHAFCVSEAVRAILLEGGLPLHGARVIHGGTDVSRFARVRERTFQERPLRLLYAGQLARHKGVHTAIEAVGQLARLGQGESVSLSIIGGGHPVYQAELLQLRDRLGLERCVRFLGPAPKEQMPHLLARFDVLLFPSIYEEPLARMTQEAMAAGLVVVGTTTGGTCEILREGETGLTFPPAAPQRLAYQLTRLLADPALCQRLARAGRQRVLDYFNLDRMVDEIDEALRRVHATLPAPARSLAHAPA